MLSKEYVSMEAEQNIMSNLFYIFNYIVYFLIAFVIITIRKTDAKLRMIINDYVVDIY